MRGRILVIGQGPTFAYPASGFASPHGVEARDVGLCRGLAKMGWQVELVAAERGWVADTFYRTSVSEAAYYLEEREYAAVLLVDVTAHHVVDAAGDALARVKRHQNVGMVFDSTRVLDGFSDALSYVRFFGPSSPQAVAAAKKLWPGKPIALVRWGIPVIDQQPPNPWPDVKFRAVYVGCVDGRYLDRLNNLAGAQNAFEVWVGGLFRPGGGPLRGLSDDERQKLCASQLKFLSDIRPAEVGWHPAGWHGPITYGDHWDFLCHADAGLVFHVPGNVQAVSCKIHEYLGCGLPVVYEQGVVNDGDVFGLRAGCEVVFDDWRSMYEAVCAQSTIHRDRNEERIKAQALGTWDDAARILDSYFMQGA